MGSLLEVLADVCRKHPLREKIVVVPSLAVGHQIGDALARAGTHWINLRFETTRTIADAVALFDLAREGWTVLSRAQALAILERACDRVLDERSYFAELRGRPGLYRAIQRSIDDLRHAGLRELPADAFEDRRKASDLTRILEAYEDELAQRKFVDRFGVLHRAIEIAQSGRELPWGEDTSWVVAEDVEGSSAEQRLVELVARQTVGGLNPGVPLVHHEIGFVRAVGEENEIRHALRKAETFDDVEILYTQQQPYLALAYELTSEHAIPATFAEGISASYTRPGQAALGFLRWVGEDFDASHLQKIARAGAMRIYDDALTPFTFGRVLRKAMIGWGRERYAPRLAALITHLEASRRETDSETRIAGIDREIARTRATNVVVDELLAMTEGVSSDVERGARSFAGGGRSFAVYAAQDDTRERAPQDDTSGRAAQDDTSRSAPHDDTVESGALARATLAFLDRFAATRNEIDGMALAALRRMLAELTRLPEARAPRSVAIERLRQAIADVHVAASNPRPGHVHVAPIRSGGWSGRRTLFVVGLDDAKHPGSGLQDPIVLDAERSALNQTIQPRSLDLLGDAPSRASARLRALFGRVRDARWTLSWTQMDLHERRSGFPSRDVLEVYRALHGAEATFEQLIAAAEVAGFLEGERPLSLSEWFVGERFLKNNRDRLQPVLHSEAWRAGRASDAITEYDGKIHVDPRDIDPRLTGRTYSASQLEKMARCPFGWFLERVLKIEPVEELDRVQDQWLDALQFGSLVHEVLETTMTEIAASRVPVSYERHHQRMEEIASAAVQRWREEVPPGTESAFTRQSEELHATCEIFLRTEERHSGRIEPMFFELPFGGPESPFAIDLGGNEKVFLRGSIDRVDRDRRTGDWEVWDYKTGSLYEYGDAWDLKAGTKLQHVIYTRALEHILRERALEGRVQCAGYYFPTQKGAGERAARRCAPGELERALNRLFDVVGSGFFPQPDAGRCSFCPYPSICGDAREVEERMARKQAMNAGDPAVRAWRELQEVE